MTINLCSLTPSIRNLSKHMSFNGIQKSCSLAFYSNKKEASLCLRVGYHGIPKKGTNSGFITKGSQCYGSGEDTSFCRIDGIGVADGVGGWKLKGGNSAFYSRKLVSAISHELDKYDDIECDEFSSYYQVEPINVLKKAYDIANEEAEKTNIKGSATILIALLRQNILKVANLGDCGLLIIRNNEFMFRSEEQQHSFNFPFQLGLKARDKPQDSLTFNIHLKKDDIIIASSDGLFDNLFDEEIIEEVKGHLNSKEKSDSHSLSVKLATRAYSVAENSRSINTPFQMRAVQEGLYFQGGKRDDISVIVGIVCDNEDSPDRR